MRIKTVINVLKVASLAMTIVPPVVGGAKVITKLAVDKVQDKINNSERINEIKKDFEIRRQGIIDVEFKEV